MPIAGRHKYTASRNVALKNPQINKSRRTHRFDKKNIHHIRFFNVILKK